MLPKGLYGRAALILILPIITIQLVVSVVFIQRLFDGVTRQMTASIATELEYVVDRLNRSARDGTTARVISDVAAPLGYRIRQIPSETVSGGVSRGFDDLTGRVVVEVLRERLPGLRHVDLKSDPHYVTLQMETAAGAFAVRFDRYRVSASNPHQLLVLMVVVSVFMTAVAFIFLKNQMRPIRRLAAAAEAFGKGRHVPYHVSGATEVRQAGQAFLDMRARIERQIEQRTMMLSGVSHDLRTPLTRLKLGLAMCDDQDIAALGRDVDEMEKMLDEFLAFARGDSLEETTPTDPVRLAAQVAEDAGRGAQRSAGRISFVPASGGARRPVKVPMRPQAVRRALENLVANALRYGTHCRLSVSVGEDHVLFTVEDDGPGIDPAERSRALRPFVRLDNARNQNRGSGVGLGLAIASDVAGSHGGVLNLSDSSDLGGLKAELRLPR